MTGIGLILVALSIPQAAEDPSPRLKALTTIHDGPVVRMFLPGIEVRELPVTLTNLNNLEYTDDGRLFAGGYDGRLHLLRDTGADHLEHQVTTFSDRTSDDYPLGFAVHKDALYVMRRHAVMRHVDTDGDGVPDREEVAAGGWQDPEVDRNTLMTHRRVDDALGLAIGPDGSFYVSIGAANYANAYLVSKDGQAHLDLTKKRGCVLKIPPNGKNPELFATGVRFLVSMQFNRHGDLFATDQEGATWLPNGNPFDELLHVQAGRHYGFPPRHPKYLPNVIDEPSLFDYAPQHQSTCGFRFNERRPGRAIFGPSSWEGDAFVVAMSRGKLYRTRLARTAAGYVAQNQLIASFGMLPIDLAISPQGDLVVACHSGAPDWGSGPKGIGKIFKISWKEPAAVRPVLAYPAGPGETVVAFGQALDPAQGRDLARKACIEFGPYVTAGDRFERYRPGYQVVKNQLAAPRWELPILSAGLSPDGRSLLLRTVAREQAMGYAVTLGNGVADLGFDLSGVQATWTSAEGSEHWSGWIPHADLTAARAFTRDSAEHDRLWSLVDKPGRLVLKTQLDLKQMLQPAVQPGSSLDIAYPPEEITVAIRGGLPLQLVADGLAVRSAGNCEAHLTTVPGTAWIPITLTVSTGAGADVAVSWHTQDDPRPRALPICRLAVPWARPPGARSEAASRTRAELDGGRWEEGKKLFFGDRTACGKCHQIRGEGGKIGPDLSNLVHRDYESVMKDIVEPSAAINPDHLAYTVRLKSGDVLAGVIVDSTQESIVLGTVSGEPVPVPRAKIDRMEPSKLSLMPENLLQGMSSEQIRDLMTFLLSGAPR
jgi:putative heme-binding domain-containing protein